jgi:putative transposase
MPYNPQIHHRRSIRLQGHDYTQPGAYFITICTKHRQCLFGDIVAGEMQLNNLCKIAFNCWQEIPEHFSHIQLDAFVVMPNHLHGILLITHRPLRAQDSCAPTSEKFGKPVPGYISTVIRSYKAAVSRQINIILDTNKVSIWQQNLYEHIGRDEKSVNNIRQYIIDNAQHWAKDSENPIFYSDSKELLFDIPF